MRCHTRNLNQTQVKLANNDRHALFCRVSIKFPCAVQRLAEDIFFVPILYYSKSAARGAFPPLLDIITQIIPYHVVEYKIICSAIVSSTIHYLFTTHTNNILAYRPLAKNMHPC